MLVAKMLLVCLYKIDNIILYYNRKSGITMTTIIASSTDYSKFPSKSWRDKLDLCNDCDCCVRHNVYKPFLVSCLPSMDAIDVLDAEDHRFGVCRCKCRYLARRICEEDNFDIMMASPDPCDLPLPPSRWLAKDPSMELLDAATEAALDYYWAGQVKACQYAIFHIC
jgi:hypothetical protein